eukprot:TRINITY_DN2352_c0_g1_i1.p1 TRINITY_DN2352_c0_g1~~TRINITY_DN2352_c0_g1_i1.p1  ORF type:complete len:562 (-),score=140.52 TRINITY_DN2352_c0_g1_i1:521-2206(-)
MMKSNSGLSQSLPPLSLSVYDIKCQNITKNGFVSPVAVGTPSSRSDHSLEGDMIDVASPSARFGMDIGGTLCKVVYFEPAKELSASFVNSEQIREASPCENPTVFENKREICSKVTVDVKSKKAFNEISPCELERGSKSSGHDLNHEQNGRQRQASDDFLAFDSIKTSLDVLTEEKLKEGIPAASHARNLRKIWLSSHASVNIAGFGMLYFKCFETWRMEEFLRLVQEHSLVSGKREIGATGGGARKFFNKFSDSAGLQLKHHDELKSLVWGIDYLVRNVQHEIFEYPIGSYKAGRIQRPWRTPEYSSDEEEHVECIQKTNKQPGHLKTNVGYCSMDNHARCDDGDKTMATASLKSCMLEKDGKVSYLDGSQGLYPYLVVNIGSGVSILKVDSPEKFHRVGGTSLGGSFEEAITLATKGDSTQIDMLVGDIYGGDYTEMGLAATTVASSFGKLVDPAKRDAAKQSPEHLAKAALLMITNNIGSIAMLHAQSTSVKHVLFTGSFLHGNRAAMKLLAIAMEFWSKGQIKAIFLQHEGHAGAVGAMLHVLDHTSAEDNFLLQQI